MPCGCTSKQNTSISTQKQTTSSKTNGKKTPVTIKRRVVVKRPI